MTDSTPAQDSITLDDLMQLDEDKRYEVVDGQLIEAPMTAGFAHVIVIDNLYDILKPYVKANKLGRVQTDGLTFVLHEDTQARIRTTRIPDLFFLHHSSIPSDLDWTRPFIGAPDLAVEVASPGETPAKLTRKISDYLQYGTQEVWVIYFTEQEAHIYSNTHKPRMLQANDTLQAEALFPSLSIPIHALFKINGEKD
jgi:Uma2 family endonuclease